MIITDNLSDRLLAPTDLTENHLSALMGTLQSKAIHEADIYFQEMRSESWVLENNIIKSGAFSIARGAGIRAVSGEKSALAYTEDLRHSRLQEACQAVRTIAATGGEGIVQIAHQPVIRSVNEAFNPYESLTTDEKLALLRRANQIAREADPRISEVIVSLNGGCEIILLMNQEGQIFTDVRPLVRFNVSVLIADGDKREQGSYGGGGRHDIRQFVENNSAETFAKAAVREAIIKLDARPAPAGTMPVVLGPGWPGVLLHEAVGHGLEGDFNRKGTSTFTGRIGERVATELCTIVDDGTLPGLRGSENIDDEGTPSGRTVLIEKGILKGYLQDKMNARLMKSQPTGNGRRESYSVQPLPRMTNTFMLAGESEPEEIIRSVKKGLYAVNFAGGQVDITSGKFVFSASEAYLIEDGKVTAPVKGATLIGNGPDALKQVSMVGNDLKLDPGIGVCGKDGQSVPVGVGQPTLKLDAMTVGGTEV